MEPSQTTPPEPGEREFGWGERRRPAGGGPSADDQLGGETLGPDWGAFGEDGPRPPRGSAPDLSALFVLLDVVRRAAPAEVQERVTGLIREALLTLRSLIDWYLDRLDRSPRETQVENIPID
jgi:hypothetical protein